ncbi:hypothetical protein ACOMHN_029629 [Nucella lapillus]
MGTNVSRWGTRVSRCQSGHQMSRWAPECQGGHQRVKVGASVMVSTIMSRWASECLDCHGGHESAKVSNWAPECQGVKVGSSVRENMAASWSHTAAFNVKFSSRSSF